MLWEMKAITLMQMAGAAGVEQNKLEHSLELAPLPQGQNSQNDFNLLQSKAVFMNVELIGRRSAERTPKPSFWAVRLSAILGLAACCNLFSQVWQNIDCAQNTFSNFKCSHKLTRLCRGYFMRCHIAQKPMGMKNIGLFF